MSAISIYHKYLLLPFMLLSPSVYAASLLTYQITPNLVHPLSAIITVDTSNLQNFSLIPAKDADTKPKPLTKVTCHSHDKEYVVYNYKAILNCDTLSWRAKLKLIAHANYDASKQENLYVPGRWSLITEWHDFPGVTGATPGNACVSFQGKTSCVAFPGEHEPPLMIGWGKHFTIGLTHIQLKIYPDSDLIDKITPKLKSKLEKAFQYLTTLFHLKDKRTLAFFLLAHKNGAYSGAAGNNAMIMTYLVESDKLTPLSLPYLLRVTAHESFHTLTPYTTTHWVSESLAEYYAYKTTKLIGIEMQSPVHAWQDIKQDIPHHDLSLYDAGKRAVDEHSYEYNALFYTKGAAFWDVVDHELQTSGSSLDQFISKIEYEDSTKIALPLEFQEKMNEILGSDKWNTVVLEYLN